MAFSSRNFGLATGAGGIGAGLAGMFMGGENPADAAMPYLNKIPREVKGYYEPYIEAGKGALDQARDEYGNLIRNPAGKFREFGQGFQQSPGFQFALQKALQGAGHAAAAGGMAGSPQHEQQAMELATQLGNQDYYNYINHIQNLFGTGLEGIGGIAKMGQQAGSSLADQIAQALAAKSALAYKGAAAENERTGSNIGNILQGAGTLAAFL